MTTSGIENMNLVVTGTRLFFNTCRHISVAGEAPNARAVRMCSLDDSSTNTAR